jgi:hypothetical protein
MEPRGQVLWTLWRYAISSSLFPPLIDLGVITYISYLHRCEASSNSIKSGCAKTKKLYLLTRMVSLLQRRSLSIYTFVSVFLLVLKTAQTRFIFNFKQLNCWRVFDWFHTIKYSSAFQDFSVNSEGHDIMIHDRCFITYDRLCALVVRVPGR